MYDRIQQVVLLSPHGVAVVIVGFLWAGLGSATENPQHRGPKLVKNGQNPPEQLLHVVSSV